MLLKQRHKEREDDEQDLMFLRKREDPGIWNRKKQTTLFRELTLEEAMDLSQDRLHDDDDDDDDDDCTALHALCLFAYNVLISQKQSSITLSN
jgi:hypothetical protein